MSGLSSRRLETVVAVGNGQRSVIAITDFPKNAMPRQIRACLDSLPGIEASFVEPMECLSVSKLPDGVGWIWEIKLDGYRALAVKSRSGVTLFSRRKKSFNKQFHHIVESLADLAEGTVLDGEVVAINDSGRSDFNQLQNFRAEADRIHYYVFDLLCWEGRDLSRLPLVERRELLKSLFVVRDKRIRISDYVEAAPNTFCPRCANRASKESSGSRRTAPTNRVKEAARGSSIA